MLLKEIIGTDPFVVVDVGAAVFLPESFQAILNDAKFYLVEPHPPAAKDLREKFAVQAPDRIIVVETALSGQDGPRTLYASNSPTGASLLRLDPEIVKEYCDPDYFFPMKEIPVNTVTLQTMLDAAGEKRVDFVKLDTQGTELEILEGMGDRLGDLLVFEVEIGMPGAYVGAASFGGFEAFARKHGLRLMDMRLARTKMPYRGNYDFYSSNVFGEQPGVLSLARKVWEVDAVFIRDFRTVLARKDAKMFKRLIAAHCLFRFFSEAHFLASMGQSEGLFGDDEASLIRSNIVRWHGGVQLAHERGFRYIDYSHGY